MTIFDAASRAMLLSRNAETLLSGVCEALAGQEFVAAAAVFRAAGPELRPAFTCGEFTDPALEMAQCALETGVAIADGLGRAAIPLAGQHGASGVLFCIFDPPEAAAELETVLRRIAENMALVLERFDEETEKQRLGRMVKALSASNEAILRAETRERLFELVCQAAEQGGDFTGIIIALAEPDSDFLRLVANTATVLDRRPRHERLAVSEAYPGGRGLTGRAFRTGKPCVSNDYLAELQLGTFQNSVGGTATRSGAALPLLSRGKPVGVLLFVSPERNTFTPEFVELLERLAANMSFALENFDRAEEKEKAEERIKYLATHDSLTELPNRAMFNELLSFSLKTGKRYQRRCAVLFVDLDRFKIINDSLGHAMGDALLKEIAQRLRKGLRESDVVARLGGDEFMLLLNEVTDKQHVVAIARDMLSAISQPVTLDGHECRVTASIGVSIYPDDGLDEHSLVKYADMAMYLAKTEGKNDVRLYSREIKAQSIERLVMEVHLRQALEREQFCLHYQPKLDVGTQTITGVEALLRWNHPELGLLPPMQFIPLAEETGLIVPIGRWALHTACQQNMAWQRAGLPPLSMAVNVSPRQFSDENLLRDIDEALSLSGMPPQLLQIEITESMVMLNIDRALGILDAIQQRGVRLAIDDFGTGYSSMSTLKRFPVDTIKIDRSFVRDLPQNTGDKAIAEAIISMGKALGLTIVAEGVETAEQDEFLRAHCCDEIQGFLFSEPVPAEEIGSLLMAPPALLRLGQTAGEEDTVLAARL